MNKITQFLEKDKTQRISYIVLLIFWIIVFLDAEARAHITSYTDYLPLIFIIPVILLVLQILFNNRILWTIIVTYLAAYTLRTFFNVFTYIVVDQHREYSHAVEWNATTIVHLGVLILTFIAINLFVFKLKPIKK